MDLEYAGFFGGMRGNPDPGAPDTFDLPLPADLKRGDLLLAAEVTYPGTQITPDARWTEAYALTAFPDWGQYLWWWIYDGEDDRPITMRGAGASSNVYNRNYYASVAAFRNCTPLADLRTTAPWPTIPGASARAGISVVWARASIGGWSMNPWGGTAWTQVTGGGGAYASIAFAIRQGEQLTPQTGPAPGNNQFPLMCHVFPVEVGGRQVTRLYPRDDGYGLSAAPRLHPRPKGEPERVFSRYQ